MRVRYKRFYEISYYTTKDIVAYGPQHKIERQIETYHDKAEAEARAESLKTDSNYYMVRLRSYKKE